MRITTTRLAVFAVIAVLAVQPAYLLAQPLVLTSEQLDALGTSCSTVQISLQKLQRSDAVSRINHGRDYDQLLKQVGAFNGRLAYNKINLPQLSQIASDMQATVEQFRTIYNSYDALLDSAINRRCQDDPADFYNQIVKARDQRDTVYATIGVLDAMIVKYRDEVQKYRTTLTDTAKGATQ